MKVKKTPHTYLKKVFTQKNKTKQINETTNRKDYHVGEEAKVRNMSCLYNQVRSLISTLILFYFFFLYLKELSQTYKTKTCSIMYSNVVRDINITCLQYISISHFMHIYIL